MWRAVFPLAELEDKSEVKEFFSLHEGIEPIVRTFFGYAFFRIKELAR